MTHAGRQTGKHAVAATPRRAWVNALATLDCNYDRLPPVGDERTPMAIGNGGGEAKRGFEFETQSLLTYLLIRFLEGNEKFNITFEKQQDPTIFYPATSKRMEITELIQCKKRESVLSDTDPAVAIEGWDPWFLGDCGKGDLGKWLQSPTGTSPIVKLLESPTCR